MQKPNINDFDILSSAEQRSGVEERWVSFQPLLSTRGYRLRPRYQPDWIPSWKQTGMRPSQCEDSIDCMPVRVLDATRIADDRQVIIKMVIPQKGGEGQDELDILQRFSKPPLKAHPSNHVVPCLDTFPIPGIEFGHFVVMPLLGRYDEPQFGSLAELHDCLLQLFDGLVFMHENGTSHCDIAPANIMMDARPLFDEPFHPVEKNFSLDIQRMIYPRYTRLEKGVRYYFIDMGYATWFRNPNSPRLITGRHARERAPEQTDERPYSPFLVDIYQLGMFIKHDLMPKYATLEFLKPLTTEMTRIDPSTRPVLTKARQSMDRAFLGLSGVRYRWPLIPTDASVRARGIYFVWGVVSEMGHWLRKIISFFLRKEISHM